MIVLRNVTIGNFLSIESATLTLDDQGLVLIEGINEDDPSAVSNGSGKSSIVDAISWCLYGQTARGTSADSVVNIKAGKDCFVEINLDIDGAPYTIMRGRKHKTLRNAVRLRQGPTDLTLGTDKLTQERINGLLGCSVHTFNAAIYMGQENMADLPNMTDKGLKAVLEEALTLDKLDAALAEANHEITVLEAAHRAKTVKVAHNQDIIDGAERSIHTLRIMRDQCADDIKSLKEDLVEQAVYHKREIYEVDESLAEANKKFRTTLVVTTESPADIAARRMVAEISPINMKSAKVQEKISQVKADNIALERHLRHLKSAESDCPTCKRQYDVVVDHTAEIEATEDQIKANVDKLVKLDLVAKDVRSEADRALLRINQDRVAATAAYEGIETLKKEMANLSKRKIDLEARHRAMYDRTTEAIKSKQERMADCQRTIDDHLRTVESLEGTNVALRDNLITAEDELETLGKVKHALGRKGFRGEILDQVTPYLNTRTQHYLEGLTDGNIEALWSTITQNADGDYVENFHIEVKHQSGVDKFALLSGGEKRKVRLACALALQDLVATRAVKPIKLFIADEIDDAIDEAGLELLMGILEQKARDVGSVFVISHNDLGDWCRNKITVTKRDGVSTFKAP